jgi:DNA-binding winged helix-turn-helix (wHTH) protein/tetratricopeptide (TPR) repeat protein
MREEQVFLFDSFRLDLANASLRRGKHEVFLTPKAFSMLRYLVEHAGQLVTKDDLWHAAWPGITVTDAALTVCMSEVRKALGDNAKTPRYVETVHRRGYRFVTPVTTQAGRSSTSGVWSRDFTRDSRPKSPTPSFVGREEELAQLRKWLGKALNAERQIVFVTGEPGIGKTTLVEVFLQQVAADGTVWIGRGQCIEHYGAGEAYLPVLDALGRLCREPRGERLIELLDQYAPTWLVQMPGLLSAAELETLHRKVSGATRERMLRELTEAVEVITRESPLVLQLEDLHWSDYSTLEWLAFLGRRQEPARLLVLVTYRPVEVIVREHPLKTVKQELQIHGQCKELPLGSLSETAVMEYLAIRFAPPSPLQGEGSAEGFSHARLRKLGRTIHQRTEGNPLFMVNIVDYLITLGVIVEVDGQWKLQRDLVGMESGMPEGLQEMIVRQMERLSPLDQQMLEVASVAGAEFSVAAIAAGLETAVGEVEERCEALARREQFLRASGVSEWPDGTVAARYGFIHKLHQEVVYERVAAWRRIDLHRRIGEREERAYGDQAREIAAELAVHFQRGRDYHRAVQYCERAGENAVRRSAHQEAIRHLTRGLELLATLPDTPERSQRELALQMAMGTSLATRGFGAPETGQAYARARELCLQLGETQQLFSVLMGLRFFYTAHGEVQTARELGEQLLLLAQSTRDPGLILEAHFALAGPLILLGEFVSARAHLERSVELYDPWQHRDHALRYGVDPGVAARSLAAWPLWILGYPDRALDMSREALTLAREVAHPFSLAYALMFGSTTHLWRGEAQAARDHAEAVIALCREQGFSSRLATGTFCRGQALAAQGEEEEGIAQMLEGSSGYRAVGAQSYRTGFLAALAEAHLKRGWPDEAMGTLTEALAIAENTGERYQEARLYQLKGELLLRSGGRASEPEAEQNFRTGIWIATRQYARSWELRATMSLARLLNSRSQRDAARAILAEIYGWFTEGFDTARPEGRQGAAR